MSEEKCQAHEYRILKAHREVELETKVSIHLEKGWRTIGGLQLGSDFHGPVFYQAVAKEGV